MNGDDNSGSPDWETLLDDIVRAGTTKVAFQPIVDLRRRAVVGYEALARFSHPSAPDLGPVRWFQAAYDLGLGPELEVIALRSALRARPDLPRNCFLSVNVEPTALEDPAVHGVFAEQGDLRGVVIELTEHRGWGWADLEPSVIRLREAGAVVAVDDAGAGYAGLQQILQLRPSILKLDRNLIAGIDTDEAKVALVEMLGPFSNRIDAWLLAEGVETVGEARRLIDLQVPLVQGFLFGGPGEPWRDVDPVVAVELGNFATQASETLRRLIEPTATVRRDTPHPVAPDGAGEWAAVVDDGNRPVGLVRTDSPTTLLRPLIAGLESSPQEVAHRLSAGPGDPSLPVVVTDNAGRYLGVVTPRRLLSRLGATVDAPRLRVVDDGADAPARATSDEVAPTGG